MPFPMSAAFIAPPAPRAGCGACLAARARQTGVLAPDASQRPVGERELLVARRSGADGRADAGASAAPLLPCIGSTLVGLAVARQAQRRGLVNRSLVALAAKAKAKKKAKAGNEAVQKALAALQQLEAQPQAQGAPAKLQSVPKPKRPRPGAKDEDNGHAKPAEPAVVAEAPAAAGAKKKKAEQKDEKEAPPVAEAPAEEPVAKEEAPPVEEEPPAKEEEEEEEEVKEEEEEEEQKEEPPQAELTPEPAPQEKEVPAVPQPEEAPPPPKPQAPRSALQDAFAALADIDAPVAAPRAQVAPEQKAPSVTDDLLAAFMAPPPSEKKKAVNSGVDDLASAYLAPQPKKAAPPPPEETEEDLAVSEDDADADDDDEEDAYDDDDDDDEKDPIKRRRGDQDLVSFEMETGGIAGTVSVGLKQVVMRLGGRLVLQDASWVVHTGDKMALVGANGCGKTTQLKILTGELKPDEGEIMMNKPNIRMATLSQGFVDELDPERTLEEELLSAVPKESSVLKDIANVQKEIDEVGENSEEAVELIEKLTALQDRAEELRAYELDGRMSSILAKVGFLKEDLNQQVGLFSGGWKVRIGLSKIFMTAPDVLLLDEPTNHLDLQSVEWLEQFLYKQTLPIVVVSHDREFIDRVCNRTVETVEGMTYAYKGGYSEYIKQREEKISTWKKKYAIQEKQVREIEKFIKVNRGKQSMANARNRRITELEKWKASDKWLDPPPRYAKKIKFNFPEPPVARRGSRRVSMLAELNGVSHGYGDGADSLLLKQASFSVSMGEKIGIIGRNGSGKSTMLRLLMGVEKPSKEGGYVLPCDPEKTSFFTQHQADLLPPEKTAIKVVEEANQILLSNQELLEIMQKFRFKGDRLDIQCKDLSGGEKARLAIVRMMLAPTQLLIFDEPTNHLDVPMKETLEYSLREFEGAAVIVSHDRWFLSQTCENIVEIKDGEVVRYDGDFRHYMDKNPDVKKQIESHYTRDSQAIAPVPLSKADRKKAERGGLKKNFFKRQKQERKDMIQAMYGGGGRRRR